MDLTEKKIVFDDEELLSLLGYNDVFLQLVENRFKSSITLRGNSLILKGESDEVKTIESVFKEMNYLLKRNGALSLNDVTTVVDLVDIHKRSKSTVQSKVDNIIFNGVKDNIRAKSPKQLEYYKKVLENDLVFAIGPAGTGKTFLAVAMALAALRNNEVGRIILSRPAVEAGESLGFLPGDLREKIDPYLKPITDAMHYMLSGEKMKTLMEKQVIEITPLAYMRGRTLNNSFILLDEAQNTTITQMKMFLTRLGSNSKAIVTGDITQVDLPDRNNSGLIHAKNILNNIPGIEFIYFDTKDVVRHRLVAEIIRAYERSTENRNFKQSSDQNETKDE